MRYLAFLRAPIRVIPAVRPHALSIFTLQHSLQGRFPAMQSVPQKTETRVQVCYHQMTQKVSARGIHTTQSPLSKFRFNNAPRFNRGPPSTFGFLFHLVPDGLKAVFVLLGASAFVLFFMGPILIITLPPLFIGGLFLRKWTGIKRERDLKKRYQNLMETHLTYKGSEQDEIEIGNFVIGRVIQGIKTNENGLREKLFGGRNGQLRSQHDLESRLELGEIESIDQDFKVIANRGISEHITVMSFGLYDADRDFARLATLILTLRPKVQSLLDVHSGLAHDAVIEVLPVSLRHSSVVLKDSNNFKEPPTINIRPNK